MTDEAEALVPTGQSTDDEAKRLFLLRSLRLLDTAPDPTLDALTQMARTVCKVPISLMSLVDWKREWFLSRSGSELTEAPRNIAFCPHVIDEDEEDCVVEISDLRADPRFHENPLVTGDPRVRFYAGAPLRGPGGYVLGTLCVMDHVVRQLSDEERAFLLSLARQASQLIEARVRATSLERQRRILEDTLRVVGHDLRSPLGVVSAALELVDAERQGHTLTTDPLVAAKRSVRRMRLLLDGLLDLVRVRSDGVVNLVEMADTLDDAWTGVNKSKPTTLRHDGLPRVPVLGVSLREVFQNLLANAVEHGWVEGFVIDVAAERDDDMWRVTVTDNGVGISTLALGSVFAPFTSGKEGEHRGVGLSIVERFVEEVGGQVGVDSVEGQGTRFTFTWPAMLVPDSL